MHQVAALVLAGGRGPDFGPLSRHRTKAAFPIAGYYRIVDFVLSNLSHSGVRQVGLVIQYMPASLMEHIGAGRSWDFGVADRNLRLMAPFVGVRRTRWFSGTADAVARNLNLMDLEDCRDVAILSGDHVYRMHYRELIAAHRAAEADLTMATVRIPRDQQCRRFGNVMADGDGCVHAFVEKPDTPLTDEVSMGIYVFRREVLVDLMREAVPKSEGLHEFSLARDVIQESVGRLRARAWRFDGPWAYLADVEQYFDLHMRLAAGAADLTGGPWDIMTNFSDRGLGSRPSARLGADARVESSLISPGCRIEGTVVGSVLSPGVRVAAGAVVRHSVVFHDVTLGEGARLERVICDKDVTLEAGAEAGAAEGAITILPKGSRIAPGEETDKKSDFLSDRRGGKG